MSENRKIRDNPTFIKTQSDVKSLKIIKSAMPILRPPLKLLSVDTDRIDKALEDLDCLEASAEELASIPDRFNDYFATHGWIMYEEMDLQVAKRAIEIADSGDIGGAEAYLVEYYSPDTVRRKLGTMNHVVEFQRRMPLAQKALIDYCEGRYHACVPVLLALMDGMVNELHLKARGKRQGLFAEGSNLEAWDSISAHSKGLEALANIFRTGRKKTTTEKITIPYRNGILHGMDLGYGNKMVAANTWATLFALRDWAMKAEKGAIEPPRHEKARELSELLHQIRINKENQERLQQWKPRNIEIGQDIPVTGTPENYEPGSPEISLAEFLEYWQKRNYGFMAKKCLSSKSGSQSLTSPRDLKLVYSSKNLKSFEFEEIKDQAPAVTVIGTKLIYEYNGQETEKSFDFRLISLDSNWKVQIRDYAESNWLILNWNWL